MKYSSPSDFFPPPFENIKTIQGGGHVHKQEASQICSVSPSLPTPVLGTWDISMSKRDTKFCPYSSGKNPIDLPACAWKE